MADDTTATCHGCGRPNRRTGHVCEPCRQRAADQLADIPRLADMLPAALIPGSTKPSGGMKRKKADAAPLGLNLGAFNLLAAGALDIDPTDTEQVGVLPLRTWLEAWRANWAQRFDFGPARVSIPAGRPAHGGDNALLRQLLTRAGKIVTAMVYGAGDGHLVVEPVSDTLDAEMAARYGRPSTYEINNTVAALASRLDAACDHHEQIGDFLAGLRIMVGACRTVVGERSDLVFLGRCPQERRDHQAGDTVVCGGALWQDPHVTQIVCPRCKTAWPERHWLWLGKMIRDRWPEPALAHQFVGELVVVVADPGAGIAADRYWAIGCMCGWTGERVRGNKLDARGVWWRHVGESGNGLADSVQGLTA